MSPTMAHDRGRVIKAAAGAAPWYVLHCPTCPDHLANTYEQDFRFNWSLKLRCDQCKASWWVCRLCPNARSQMISIPQASRHNRLKHASLSDDTTTRNTEEVPKEQGLVDEPISSEYITRPASVAYFRAMQNNTGPTYLAMKAIFHESITSSQTDVPNEDIRTFLATAHFVSTLSCPQREDLAQLLKSVTKTTTRQLLTNTQSHPVAKKPKLENFEKQKQRSIQILTDKDKIQSTILSGKFSLYENLAHPEVRLTDTHAYILPSDAVADFMAHGFLAKKGHSQLHKVEALSCSKKAKEIMQQNSDHDCTTLIGTLWSNGFEPNYSLTNQGSAWIMTLCIQPTILCNNLDLCHVYPIAVGREADDNKEVLEIILNNIQSMGKKRMNHPPQQCTMALLTKMNQSASI